MKNHTKKRIQIQPIKSPSPDYLGRSSLKITTSPFEEIQRYKQIRSYSPQMTNSIVYSYPGKQIQQLTQQVNRLRKQLAQKKAEQWKNAQLTLENNKLIEEVKNLKILNDNSQKTQQTREVDLSSTVYRELEKRLKNINQQNQRLQAKLERQIQQVQLLERQNQKIRKELQFFQQQKLRKEKDFRLLEEKANQRYQSYEAYITQKVKLVSKKVDQIENAQKMIEGQVKKKSQMPKNNPKIITKQIINGQSISRFENEKNLAAENMKLQQKLRSFSIQLDNVKHSAKIKESQLQQKIQQLRKKTIRIPQQNRQTKIIQQRTFKQNQSELSFLREKINHLEADLKNKIQKINNIQEQIELKDRSCSLTQKRIQKVSSQNLFLKKTIQDLNQSLQRLNRQMRESNLQLNSYKDVILERDAKIKQFQKYNSINNKFIEQQIKKRENILQNTLKNYLNLINDIKKTLNSSDMEKIVSGTIKLQKDNFTFEKINQKEVMHQIS